MRLLAFSFFCVILLACSPKNKQNTLVDLDQIKLLIDRGELMDADEIINSQMCNDSLSAQRRYLLLQYKNHIPRIRREFCYNKKEVKDKLSKYFSDSLDTRMDEWESRGVLECRILDGKKKYFRSSVNNLFRLDPLAAKKKKSKSGDSSSDLQKFRLKHIQNLVSHSKGDGETAHWVPVTLDYIIRLKADAVPDGEIVRCWMPYPREGHERQKSIVLHSTQPAEHLLAPNSSLQRSVYCQRRAHKGEPVEFRMSVSMEVAAQWIASEKMNPLSYNITSQLYRDNTCECPPQIVFTPRIRHLADSICGEEINPVKQVKRIYEWIDGNIVWASALEYSIMPQIPSYVLQNKHGDCGMKTLLFMSMARYRGIPVKWQSGWMLHPGKVNLHDWCEVYYQGYGWIPLDQSFGIQPSSLSGERNFYVTGIDAYRFIVNDDFSQPFFPAKIWPRSEPIDFQRGELEWRGGNLYFDKWSYHMEVTYRDK